MQPAISQLCTLASTFDADIAAYADAAGNAIELWFTKLETYLQSHSLTEVRTLAEDRGSKFAAASYQGGILLSQGTARREAWEQFERRLDVCAALGVPTVVITADFLGSFSDVDIQRSQVSLKQAGQAAADRGVRLALEFQARNTFLNNLETAATFVNSVQEPAVGICLDLFHYAIGPSKPEDLGYLTSENLFHVQFSDVADRPRELATDSDRIFPGDGDFRLQPVVEHLRRIGYAGYVSLELPNPMIWEVPPTRVAEIGLTALRKVLGLAQGGRDAAM